MSHWGDEVAAVLVEPIVGNFGMVKPQPGFLEEVNNITHEHGALVIYDEVITAFRFHYGAAQDLLNGRAEWFTIGKMLA